jgi:hypothetical protein
MPHWLAWLPLSLLVYVGTDFVAVPCVSSYVVFFAPLLKLPSLQLLVSLRFFALSFLQLVFFSLASFWTAFATSAVLPFSLCAFVFEPH